MSATTQVTTFSDLYTDLQNRVRIPTGVTATENQAKRYINIALYDMHMGNTEKFTWAERQAVLRTQAQYTTGTITTTKGSTTATGASTAWNTNNDFSVANVRVGGKLVIDGGTDVYEVTAVASDTSLTLNTPFIDTAVSAGSYVYYEDSYSLHADFLRPLNFRFFDQNHRIELLQRREFNERFIRNKVTGKPLHSTIIEDDFASSTAPVRKVVFHKPPDANYLIPYSFITNKLAVDATGTALTQLSSDTDEPIVPLYARHVIVMHALYHWYRDQKNDTRSAEAKAEYDESIVRLTADVEVGQNRPQFRPRSYLRQHRRTRGKRVLGSAFDELRI